MKNAPILVQKKQPEDGNVQSLLFFLMLVREGFKKNKKNGWIYPSGLAGWGLQGAKIQPKKKIKIQKKYKDDQNGLIQPEKGKL